MLDDLQYRLKAGLIGAIGDLRITSAGMTQLSAQINRILAPLRRDAVIDDYTITIPVADALALPPSARGPADEALIRTTRETRTVAVQISFVYGPAIHVLDLKVAPTFF